MKQAEMDSVMSELGASSGLGSNAGWLVYNWLSKMIDRERNYFYRQVWRTARGLVKQWLDKQEGGGQ